MAFVSLVAVGYVPISQYWLNIFSQFSSFGFVIKPKLFFRGNVNGEGCEG